MEMYLLFYHFFFSLNDSKPDSLYRLDQTISLSHNSCLLISKIYVVDYQKLVKCSQESCNSIDTIELGGEVSNPLLINEGIDRMDSIMHWVAVDSIETNNDGTTTKISLDLARPRHIQWRSHQIWWDLHQILRRSRWIYTESLLENAWIHQIWCFSQLGKVA